MRIVSWNIQHGGGARCPLIMSAIRSWDPDVICLVEFRGTSSSQNISEQLRSSGWRHQFTTARKEEAKTNALLVASRNPLQLIVEHRAPVPHRFLATKLNEEGISLGLLHVPNREDGAKYEFHDFVLNWTTSWQGGPAIILGDTNTGQPGIDEESKFFNRKEGQWMRSLHDSGWLDAWRALHGDQRVYSWHERRRGNGFRLDQAFLNAAAHQRLMSITYDWGTQDDGKNPSDHAAMILDIKEAPAPE